MSNNYSVYLFNELPFCNITDYDIECEYQSARKIIHDRMNNSELLRFIRDNRLNQALFDVDAIKCDYYDSAEFCRLNRKDNTFLNIVTMNIVSLPKHAGELACFISTLETHIDVIVLTEIGARNISTVEHLFQNYTFFYVTPCNNPKGGVGIYVSHRMNDIVINNECSYNKTCNCVRCEIESLFVDFTYGGKRYTVGGIYRHPNGNVDHFCCDLEELCNNFEHDRNIILAGDMNINIINFDNAHVLKYLTLMMSHRFLPHITLPTRIATHRPTATCIDHIFVKQPVKDTSLDLISGILYCDLSDHLPCFVSMCVGSNVKDIHNRPMTRLFGERQCQSFVNSMAVYDWDVLYNDSNDFYATFITAVKEIFDASFPYVRVSRKRFKDKPWITKGLKTSVKHSHVLYKRFIRRQTV